MCCSVGNEKKHVFECVLPNVFQVPVPVVW